MLEIASQYMELVAIGVGFLASRREYESMYNYFNFIAFW